MAGRFKVPEGMAVHAVCFALDLNPEQDVCVRRLAAVGAKDGTILERVPGARPLETALKEARHLSRAADIRAHHIHDLAGGNEARKGGRRTPAGQPRDGVPA